MGISHKAAEFLAASHLAAAEQGDAEALFELGAIYSSGGHGVDIDLIEAHKWYNLAALRGSDAAHVCRGEVAEEMDRSEVAEAQKKARAWIARLDRQPLAA